MPGDYSLATVAPAPLSLGPGTYNMVEDYTNIEPKVDVLESRYKNRGAFWNTFEPKQCTSYFTSQYYI